MSRFVKIPYHSFTGGVAAYKKDLLDDSPIIVNTRHILMIVPRRVCILDGKVVIFDPSKHSTDTKQLTECNPSVLAEVFVRLPQDKIPATILSKLSVEEMDRLVNPSVYEVKSKND